jgi:hypothetical protein
VLTGVSQERVRQTGGTQMPHLTEPVAVGGPRRACGSKGPRTLFMKTTGNAMATLSQTGDTPEDGWIW